ncbi:MAG TPA: MerR family transcriptional regulator [Desulfobacteraceae bacterium]|nr:MerR family transcriptional regulator [Desulfobacteraceae bacterium]HPJ67873.1 MerR family transcriptional regulator [Desulfobacteraceae bacterium]HPQ28238.1 MerR family transcriptional regulator [Desulfobacteraceae bacterium]
MVPIPDHKRFFRIGEASRIVGVKPYVLRFWENEFPQVRPRRADSKQRTYQKHDLEAFLEIKSLLYEEKMTIEGARQRLKRKRDKESEIDQTSFKDIRNELQEILKILK